MKRIHSAFQLETSCVRACTACVLRAGKVYDVTPFMDDHPGGGEIMLSAAGKDATNDFEARRRCRLTTSA